MDAKRSYMRRVALVTLAVIALGIITSLGTRNVLAQDSQGAADATQQVATTSDAAHRWDLSVAIAVAIAAPCLAAGYAVGKVGAAALGAASEKPELLTRSLLFVALAEGIAIYGLLVAVLLYMKL